MSRNRVLGNLLCIVVLLLCGSVLQAQTTFTNSSAITINDNSIASPYPSTITVNGLGTQIANTNSSVQVRINGLTHASPDDIGIVLVGPTGAAFLLQDGAGDFDTPMNNVTYTISDSGASALPNNTAWTAGAYRPAAYYGALDAALFPSPGPGATYNSPATLGTSTLQATYAGTNPNGVWRLYIVDSIGIDAGNISGGWSLTITTTSAATVTVSGKVLAQGGRGLTGAKLILSGGQGGPRVADTGVGGNFEFTGVPAGTTYVLTVQSRLYSYSPVNVDVSNSNVSGLVLQPNQ